MSDQLVHFANGKPEDQPDHPLRFVCVVTSPHTNRGKYGGGSTGPGSNGILRIATNLLDVPAEIIACMLLCLWTGRKPTKRTYEMVCYYFLGLATEAELLKHIEKMKPRDTS